MGLGYINRIRHFAGRSRTKFGLWRNPFRDRFLKLDRIDAWCFIIKQPPTAGRVAQAASVVGRALRARRDYLKMLETRRLGPLPAVRSGVRALPSGTQFSGRVRTPCAPRAPQIAQNARLLATWGVLRCLRWNGVPAWERSSVRSAMFIAPTVLASNKLRQERHGNGCHKHRPGRALRHKHAAPDGAWRMFWESPAINMALLTELFRGRIPPETAKNHFGRRAAECAPYLQAPRPPGLYFETGPFVDFNRR